MSCWKIFHLNRCSRLKCVCILFDWQVLTNKRGDSVPGMRDRDVLHDCRGLECQPVHRLHSRNVLDDFRGLEFHSVHPVQSGDVLDNPGSARPLKLQRVPAG